MAVSKDTNKIRFGLSNVHVWPKTGDNEWGTVIKIPGAVNLSMSPEGSSENFYADNGAYYSAVANNGWSGEVEMAKIPDDFYVMALGWEIDKNGALVEISDAQAKPFAFAFEVNGDQQKRRTVYYECTVERPSNEDKTTEDTITPTTEKLTIKAVPVNFGDKQSARLSLPKTSENEEVYNAFFTKVITPDYTAEANL